MGGVKLDSIDYYVLLGVERDATADAVKRAFHDFARRYHPDRHLADPAAHRRMLALYRRGTEAYRVLSDPGSRRLYAQCLDAGMTRYDPSVARQSQRPTLDPKAKSARVEIPAPARVPSVAPTGVVAGAGDGPSRDGARKVPSAGGTVRPRSSSPPSGSRARASRPPGRGPALADATSGRAREFALRAQRALEVRQYRSARLSLRLALRHDEGNARLQEELTRLDKLLG